ncbi:hypothetical protein C5B42_00080 [Candidatus Cerribacteria bacterium 'Amazon FNV 2010 28 9']|uniref:Uncharacterized protein n=1 Tax=Candidatus Cerribacteria bacterium 'Amazon FNV 2010 28 9' TaxID=2081795 RepID=A0A317JQH9_9BACT|nr:MAG: hypothetical protein C5B42_00080 [Candidatus Cerribacteria bacterium 'Amazon FNV 2010 28 9']
MSSKEIESTHIIEAIRTLQGGKDNELIKQHAEAGVSMYGTHPQYPGEYIELSPDGHYFIVQREHDQWVRIQEVKISS